MSDQPPTHPDPHRAADVPAPPPPPSAPGAPQHAAGPGAGVGGAGVVGGGLPKRFLARILDALIVGIPLGLVLIVVLDLAPTGIAYAVIASAANVAYFVFLESAQGATYGKRILGLSVTSAASGRLTPEQAFKRNWWLLLGLVPVIGGLASLAVTIYIAVTISSDAANRGWHDKLADATVLDR